MSIPGRRIAIAGAALATLACSRKLSETQRLLDLDEVRQVATGIVQADNLREIERVLAFYDENAVLLPPNDDPVRGLEAIRPRYEGLFADYDPEIAPEIEEAEVSGDLAYVRGRNGGVLRSRGDAPDRTLNDVYLMILRRGESGWRITRLMWHATGPTGTR